MCQLDAHTLTMVIRGFSNEITVRWLADKLCVSRSTLARCKNGAWPPSITLEAVYGAFEECRERFFEGDGDALARSAIMQLQGQGIQTLPLEQTLERNGYEAFLTTLLSHAQSGEPLEPLPHEDAAPASDSPPTVTEHPIVREPGLLLAIPLAVVLLMGLFNVSLASLLTWANDNWEVFALISLFIALLPAITGTLVDAPHAWHAFKKDHPDVPFSWQAFSRVSQLGGIEGIVPGMGRFHLAPLYFAYQPVCNILGAMCYLSLFYFLTTLPGFWEFFQGHEWIEYFKVGIAVAFFVAFGQMRDGYSRDALESPPQDGMGENPDNYLPTRVHVWANTLHLVWTISLTIVLLLILLAYAVMEFRSMEVPLLTLWPIMQAMAFLAYSCVSPVAVRLRVTSVGIFAPGVALVAVGFITLTLVCFLPSWTQGVICLVCALCMLGAALWSRHSAQAKAAWVEQGRASAAYSIAIAACVFCLLAIALATNALC